MSSAMATVVNPQVAINLFHGPSLKPMWVASGNGVNEAWSFSLSGIGARVLGFVGSEGASRYTGLEIPGAEIALTEVPGETRVDEYRLTDGREEHIRGHSSFRPGPDHVNKLRAQVFQAAQKWVVLTGALALGMDPMFFARETLELHELGVNVVADIRALELRRTLPFSPDVIKPNLGELEELLGYMPDVTNDKQLLEIAESLLPKGLAIFSLGADGIFARAPDGRAWRGKCDPPWLRAIHRVGCGDAFIAWLTSALIRGYDIPTALRHALAAAAANLTTIVPGHFPADLAFELVNDAELRKVA